MGRVGDVTDPAQTLPCGAMTPRQRAESWRTLGELSEDEVLAELRMPPAGPAVLVGPGDDTALLAVPGGQVLVTTDAMVLGHDWLDQWSSAADVGAKCVAQNAADIAAMGGVPTGIVTTLVADPQTPVSWVRELSEGMAGACERAGIAVLGGDLSSAPAGVRMVSMTALGQLPHGIREPVLRGGARADDVVAVSDRLGRSGAGLALLRAGDADRDPELVGYHLRPAPAYERGPDAARGGGTAMLDISDGLLRDASRIASASGVLLDLSAELLDDDVAALEPAVGNEVARDCVLNGGEEHTLLATFGPNLALPQGWRAIGSVRAGSGVALDGIPRQPGGWDHFAG